MPGPHRHLRALLALAVVAALLSGCRSSDGPASARPAVVVTTSIIGELVRAIGGDAVSVRVLIPEGADPHDIEPSATDAARMRQAALVVANGLGLEEGLASALRAARADGVPVLELGPSLDPVDAPGTDHPDPHVWLDPDRWARAAALVVDALADRGIDRTELETRADAWRDQVRATGTDVRSILASVPAGDRLLITNHDALEYFATRFGFKVIGVVIPGGSTLAEPSAADISRLATTMRTSDVRAVFTETTTSPRLVQMLAKEVGGEVAVIELPTDSLDHRDPTYRSLLTTLAHRIADGLATGTNP